MPYPSPLLPGVLRATMTFAESLRTRPPLSSAMIYLCMGS